MNTVFLSVGLIHRYGKQQSEYLVRKKDHSEFWSPIVGERLEKESFRETIIREISWVLNLDRKKDFLVSNMAVSSQEYVTEEEFDPCHYAIAFYRAKLFTKPAREKIETDGSLRWISSRELYDGGFGTEDEIDPDIVGWINRWSVLNPWE